MTNFEAIPLTSVRFIKSAIKFTLEKSNGCEVSDSRVHAVYLEWLDKNG